MSFRSVTGPLDDADSSAWTTCPRIRPVPIVAFAWFLSGKRNLTGSPGRPTRPRGHQEPAGSRASVVIMDIPDKRWRDVIARFLRWGGRDGGGRLRLLDRARIGRGRVAHTGRDRRSGYVASRGVPEQAAARNHQLMPMRITRDPWESTWRSMGYASISSCTTTAAQSTVRRPFPRSVPHKGSANAVCSWSGNSWMRPRSSIPIAKGAVLRCDWSSFCVEAASRSPRPVLPSPSGRSAR